MKRDFRILTEIGNLLYKEKDKPVKNIENDFKNNLFPLSLFARKGSLLNQKTYDYLNSVSPTKLTFFKGSSSTTTLGSNPNVHKTLFNLSGKNNETLPSLSGQWGPEQKEASIKTRNDVIYQYLKTFSIFNKKKNGILIQYNQHIGYNYNSQNILLRGVEPQTTKSLKTNKNITRLQLPLPVALATVARATVLLLRRATGTPLLEKESKINKVNTLFSSTTVPLPPSGQRVATVRELNRLKGISGLTGYNRTANNRLIKYSYKLLFSFFKSMYCLISKPVFLFTPDKVTIQLFYFLNIPKFKVFKWYSILNNKLIRQKWYSLRLKKNLSLRGKLDNLNITALARANSEFSTSSQTLSSSHCHGNDAQTFTAPGSLCLLQRQQLPEQQAQGEDFLKRNQLKTVLSYSNKEMMNRVKLSWRVKKTLFRLNKKRTKVKNILFNLNKFNIFKVFSFKFKLICAILSNKFKKPVELQLIRIHQPFHDSNILVNLLSLNIKNKKFKTNVAIEKLYAKKAIKNLYDYSIKSTNFIPTFLSGIKIRIGGRLMREPIIPRITTKNFERGASSPGKVNFLDTATITKKNRKGSYTIKISSGQNFF